MIYEKSGIFAELTANIDVYQDSKSSQHFENDFLESQKGQIKCRKLDKLGLKCPFQVILNPLSSKMTVFFVFKGISIEINLSGI